MTQVFLLAQQSPAPEDLAAGTDDEVPMRIDLGARVESLASRRRVIRNQPPDHDGSGDGDRRAKPHSGAGAAILERAESHDVD